MHLSRLPHRHVLPGIFVALCLVASITSSAQTTTVTAQVQLSPEGVGQTRKNRSNVVVWLAPTDHNSALRPVSRPEPAHVPRLVQKDKRFDPHILVIAVGTAVEFPNH